jgi:enoyl-CoA hydratase/carnithine racemase
MAAQELFLASDIRVAANDTAFSQGEVARAESFLAAGHGPLRA